MANKQAKRHSTSLIIEEMQLKPQRYHITFIKIATIKKQKTAKCWRGCGETGTLVHCWWEYKMV